MPTNWAAAEKGRAGGMASVPRPVVLILCLLSSQLVLAGCRSEEARIVDEAEAYFDGGQLELAREAYTRAIAVNEAYDMAYLGRARAGLALQEFEPASRDLSSAIDHVTDSWTGYGTYHAVGEDFLRAGLYHDAIRAFQIAVDKGFAYSDSYTLASDPTPGAQPQWYRTLSEYQGALARSYGMASRCRDAVEAFEVALNIAGASIGRVDMIDRAVARAFAGESAERQEFSAVVGSYLHNLSMLQEQLGDRAAAAEWRSLAEDFDFDAQMVFASLECD